MTKVKKGKPKHLGRGLASLLSPLNMDAGDTRPKPGIPIATELLHPEKHVQATIRELTLEQIRPNPYQPRDTWDHEQLAQLAESIRVNGLVQPIVVRPAGAGFELLVGERRLRAAKLVGLKTIPAIIRAYNDDQMLELALIENIHRQDLNPIERAGAYKQYLTTLSLTQSEAAERLGENRSVIANYLRLLDLPDEIKRMLVEETLTMGHARAILALPTEHLRRKLANRAAAGRLSVRRVERLVREYLTGTMEKQRPSRENPPHIADLERRMTSQLGTKVTIQSRAKGRKGKIIIEFYSLEDFERITEQIGVMVFEQL